MCFARSNKRRRILCICTVFLPATSKPKCYNPRHPERTLLYQTIAEHYETWFELASAGQFDGQGDHHTPKPYVRQAFRKYLESGIFAHGFARARCGDCGHDYFVAFSCKGRGVCPSCNARRMVETAAHLCDHVFPRLPVRQWVLSVPKRLRYFMQRDGVVLNMVLRIFLRVIAQGLQTHAPGAANVDTAALHIGAVTFIHRFGSSLNDHVHFHVCVVDGVFEAVAGEEGVCDGVIFHPATGVYADTVAQVQASLRLPLLRPDATGNCTAPVIRPASCHWRKRRRDKGPRADGPCNCSRTRAGAAQASGPLPVGGADCPHLRDVPAFVPAVRWADAHHRLYHAQCRYPAHPGAHRCRLRAPAHFPSSRAAVMGAL